ncbi:MAG: hypothetical protein DRJ64_06480 [Thermoprotei archaeon]|nr:MAG: hypothetical protein DRJ64_06480 [Thermoprotei archaeon]
MDYIVLRGATAKRLREEARKHNLSLEEYLLELLTQDMNPEDKAREYIKASEDLLVEASEELEKDNIRQAAEKVWEAVALTVKAYALLKDSKRISSHGELWEYKRRLETELGKWAGDAWARAVEMHVCFYEGWCNKEDVEKAVEAVSKLVNKVKQIIL